MRTQGTTFSAVGHLGLIGWLFLGWGFEAEPLEFTTTTVSIISGEEFEEQIAAATPDPGTADPTVPVPPVIDESPPPTPAVEEPTEAAPPPEPVEPPIEEVPPPPPPEPLPPEPEVVDVVPVEPTPPVAPPSTPGVEVTDTPTPPDIDRVAPIPSEPTPPDTETAEVPQDAIVPDDTATAEAVVEEQKAAAPDEATTEIAIEDETPPSGLVETSLRPTARPSRPTPPTAEPAEETETAAVETPTPAEPVPELDTQTNEDDVAAALAAALAGDAGEPAAEAPAVAAGPPMTGSERDSFRVAVNGCWNVDPGSVAARVTVEVGFSLDRSGSVQGDVRLISSDGDQSATNTAFEAARRAILRCQSGGYQLPADKYEQWKDVVITFDPSGMRLR